MANNSLVQVFNGFDVRFVEHPDKVFEFGIVAADLAVILEHSNSRVMVESVDDEWKGVSEVYTQGGTQSMTVVWEPGVYQLLAKSRKLQAKPFQKWLFENVIPSIRKTGSYTEAIDPIDALIRGLEETKRVRAELESVKQKMALEAQRIDAVEELTHQLDSEMERIHKPYGDYYTAMGFLRLKGFTNISMAQAKAIGAKAAKRCKELGIEIEKMRDPRFGTVGAYPHAILEEVC